jgi:hypothetical protein
VPGRFHYRLNLPGDKLAVADFRDPIVAAFHSIQRARAAGQPPPPGDLEAVLEWLDANEQAAALCARGDCDHAA